MVADAVGAIIVRECEVVGGLRNPEPMLRDVGDDAWAQFNTTLADRESSLALEVLCGIGLGDATSVHIAL